MSASITRTDRYVRVPGKQKNTPWVADRGFRQFFRPYKGLTPTRLSCLILPATSPRSR